MSNLYVMLIVSCLSNGQDCTKTVAYEGFGMMGCLSQSQIMAAQWQKQFPFRKLKKIKCVDAKRLPFELGRNQA